MNQVSKSTRRRWVLLLVLVAAVFALVRSVIKQEARKERSAAEAAEREEVALLEQEFAREEQAEVDRAREAVEKAMAAAQAGKWTQFRKILSEDAMSSIKESSEQRAASALALWDGRPRIRSYKVVEARPDNIWSGVVTVYESTSKGQQPSSARAFEYRVTRDGLIGDRHVPGIGGMWGQRYDAPMAETVRVWVTQVLKRVKWTTDMRRTLEKQAREWGADSFDARVDFQVRRDGSVSMRADDAAIDSIRAAAKSALKKARYVFETADERSGWDLLAEIGHSSFVKWAPPK